MRQLIGFKRIKLAPGESKQITFTITPELMSIVNNEGKNIIEPGKFKITLGGNQGDSRSTALGASPVLEAGFEVL